MKTFIYASLKKIFRYLMAIVFIICGIIMTPLPIPFGLVSISIGFLFLAYESEWTRNQIKSLRFRYPKLSSQMEWWERCRFKIIADIIVQTRPDLDN